MAYVPVPKDLTKVKTKVMFNLTKRQLICFTGGALIGVPLFFLLRKPTGNSVCRVPQDQIGNAGLACGAEDREGNSERG